MNADLGARSTILIVLFFGGLLAGWFTFYQHASRFQGPVHMHAGPEGQLYIRAENRLFQYGADGNLRRQHDLSDLGAGRQGDFAVLPDGRILLTAQPFAPSILERLLIFMRWSDRSGGRSDQARAGLLLCDLSGAQCKPFNDPPLDLGRAYHLHVDAAGGAVYVSRPGRHTVERFGFNGQVQGVIDRDLEFPNQIGVHDDELYIANTNRHEIRIVSNQTDAFGRRLRAIDVEAATAPEFGERWPSTFGFIDGQLWVVINENDMGEGGIYRFDAQGRSIDRIAAGGLVEPFSIVPFDGGALVSDPAAFTVHMFDAAGQPQGAFEQGALKQFLERQRRSNARFSLVSHLFFGAFCVSVLVGLVVGTRQILATDEVVRAERAAHMPVDTSDPDILWIEPVKRFARYVRLTRILMFGLAASAVVLVFMPGALKVGVMLLLISISFFLILYPFTKLAKAKIGIKGDRLILNNGDGRAAAGLGDQIAYSDSHIVIGPLALALGNARMRIFETKQLVEHVYPQLKGANALSNTQMQFLLLKRKDAVLLYPTLGVLLMLVIVVLAETGLAS